MTDLLIKLFIKNGEDTTNPAIRTRYGLLGSAVGITCNLLLFAAKLLIGLLSGSVSIMADAINNLSDVGSSVVALFGFKMSKKPADAQHPFGHGRIEYISALLVALIIMVLGVQLAVGSVNKMIHPQMPQFNPISLIILIMAILIKIWLSLFNKKLGRKINSKVLQATGADALNDVFATGATILSMVSVTFLPFSIDGYIGFLVAIFVLYSGFGIAKDTISPLLGEPPTPELVMKITNELTDNRFVSSVHDLIIHNYGPGRIFASVHVEVPADSDIIQVHNTIDQIELKILDDLGIMMTIHMDPIEIDNEKTNAIRADVVNTVHSIDESMTIHDFRIVDGSSRIVLLFDVVVPYDYKNTAAELLSQIQNKISQINPLYHCIITMDYNYT